MILKNRVEEVTTFEMFLDNSITCKHFINGTLKTFHIFYKETLVNLQGATTINLYQYEDIYLNKTNFYLIFDYTTDTYKLFIEINEG